MPRIEPSRRPLEESDEKTREYILNLMRTCKLSARLDALENVIHELCDTASVATAIGPLWNVMQEK